jgi:hypothetical protein
MRVTETNMIPLDVLLSPNMARALLEWKRDPKWAKAGCVWPGLAKAVQMWREAAPLREMQAELEEES